MLLRYLRITEKNKLMSMRQIRMTKNKIFKNTRSLLTELVLRIHNPAELFMHLCVSTFDVKRY